MSITAGGIDTGQILANDELRLHALALMNEVIAGANNCGVKLRTGEALEQMKRTKPLGTYKPSTLIDYEARKPLEIETDLG